MPQLMNPTASEALVVKVDDSGIVLPTFTFVPHASKVPLDDIPADLVLLTKFHGHDIPATLYPCEPVTEELLRRTVKDEFSGRRGTIRLLPAGLRNSRGGLGSHFFLAGLGSASSYDGMVACAVFESFFKEAIARESVIVPFVPNAMTKESLTHRATAFHLKSVLRRVAAEHGIGKLKEIKIYCHSSAVRHITTGLSKCDQCNCENRRCQASSTMKLVVVKDQQQS